MSAGDLRGRHFTTYVDEVKALKRAGDLDAAETLLLELVAATDADGRANKWTSAPWYYNQLAIIYRKQKRYDDEIAILERCRRFNGTPDKGQRERVAKARQLRDAAAQPDTPTCPVCGVVLPSTFSGTRACPG